MKKKIIISLAVITIISIITIGITKILKKENNKYEIETYINGKLATTLPENNAGYKVSKITCNNGATGTFNYSSWRLEVNQSSSKTLCKIEFVSSDKDNFNTYLKNKACTSTPTSDNAAKDCLVNENGYRYEGENPNNYVLFNDELWRVIGVFNVQTSSGTKQDLVKLIRDETLDGLAWDSSGSNNWTTSTLKATLNEGYLNAQDTTCNYYETNTKTCYFSKTGIKSGARSKLENVVWNIGGASSTSITTQAMYEAERGSVGANNSTTNLTWTGKVGLMYPSDYGYGVLASNCARTTNVKEYNSSSCARKDWLKKDIYQWTLTPYSSYSTHVFIVNDDLGRVDNNNAYNGCGVRPSIYLKSGVKYVSGSGTYSDPYVVA